MNLSVKLSVLFIALSCSGCATVLYTERGAVQVTRKDVGQKVHKVFDKEFDRDIKGKPDAATRLEAFCKGYITEEKATLSNLDREVELKKKYTKLSSEERQTMGKDISNEFRSIKGNEIDETPLDLLMSARTLVLYTIEAMEGWCKERRIVKLYGVETAGGLLLTPSDRL